MAAQQTDLVDGLMKIIGWNSDYDERNDGQTYGKGDYKQQDTNQYALPGDRSENVSQHLFPLIRCSAINLVTSVQ